MEKRYDELERLIKLFTRPLPSDPTTLKSIELYTEFTRKV